MHQIANGKARKKKSLEKNSKDSEIFSVFDELLSEREDESKNLFTKKEEKWDGKTSRSENKDGDIDTSEKGGKGSTAEGPGNVISVLKKKALQFNFGNEHVFKDASIKQTLPREPSSVVEEPARVVMAKNSEIRFSDLIEKNTFSRNRSATGVPSFLNFFKINKKLMWRTNDTNRLRFDLFVMLLATWNALNIPYELAFQFGDDKNTGLVTIDAIIDFIFFLDILINFRTTYLQDRTGIEIFDLKKIAFHYLRGRFWIDLLSCLPFEYIASLFTSNETAVFNLFGILKLIRISRLSRIIIYLNLRDTTKSGLKLAKVIFFLILYLHCISCFLFFVFLIEEKWIPTFNYMDYTATTVFQEEDISQYYTCFYHAIQLLCGGEAGPRTKLELFMIIIMLVAGAIITANIFGTMAVLLTDLYKRSTRFQEKLDLANTSMKNMKLNLHLQNKVINYLMFTHNSQDNQKELDEFFSMISPSIKLEALKHIFGSVLKKNALFGKMKKRKQSQKSLRAALASDIIDEDPTRDVLNLNTEQMKILTLFVVHLQQGIFYPEDVIFKQGDEGNNMYFICKGECEVFVKDLESKTKTRIIVLTAGDLFGEVALVTGWARTATIKSMNYCTVASLEKQHFDEICQEYPYFLKKMIGMFSHYQDKNKKLIFSYLRNIQEFRNLSDKAVERVYYTLNEMEYKKGDVIHEDQELCEFFAVIIKGKVDLIIKDNNKKEILLETLGKGSSFNTYAALNGIPSKFKVQTKKPTLVLFVDPLQLKEISQTCRKLEVLFKKETISDPPLIDCNIMREKKENLYELFKEKAKTVLLLNKAKAKSDMFLQLMKNDKVQELILQKRNEEKRKNFAAMFGTNFIGNLKKSSQKLSITDSVIFGNERIESIAKAIRDQKELMNDITENNKKIKELYLQIAEMDSTPSKTHHIKKAKKKAKK